MLSKKEIEELIAKKAVQSEINVMKLVEGLDLNASLLNVKRELNSKQDELAKEIGDNLNSFIKKESCAAAEHRLEMDKYIIGQREYMKIVEGFLQLQVDLYKSSIEIYSDIRNCLKSLGVSNLSKGKRILNDSN
jgi:hypothetical protein